MTALPGPEPGTPVLLLHGQPGGARDWHAVVEALGPSVRAIAPDRPGWDGRSDPLDIEGNAHAAVGMLDRLGIERAVIAGHSLGAAIAAWLAAGAPERVAALVLISPAANLAALEPVDRMLATPLAGPLMAGAMMTGAGLALATGTARGVLASRLALDASYLAHASRRLLRPATWRSFAREQRALVSQMPLLEPRLAEIRAPTLVVSGSADRVVPLAAARRLSEQIDGARLAVVEGARHLLPQAHAARVAAEIIATSAAVEPEAAAG